MIIRAARVIVGRRKNIAAIFYFCKWPNIEK